MIRCPSPPPAPAKLHSPKSFDTRILSMVTKKTPSSIYSRGEKQGSWPIPWRARANREHSTERRSSSASFDAAAVHDAFARREQPPEGHLEEQAARRRRKLWLSRRREAHGSESPKERKKGRTKRKAIEKQWNEKDLFISSLFFFLLARHGGGLDVPAPGPDGQDPFGEREIAPTASGCF